MLCHFRAHDRRRDPIDGDAVPRKFHGVLRNYPGSPRIALGVLRQQDRLRLFELHSTERQILAEQFAVEGRRVTVMPAMVSPD